VIILGVWYKRITVALQATDSSAMTIPPPYGMGFERLTFHYKLKGNSRMLMSKMVLGRGVNPRMLVRNQP
jgi:hypothetical protein